MNRAQHSQSRCKDTVALHFECPKLAATDSVLNGDTFTEAVYTFVFSNGDTMPNSLPNFADLHLVSCFSFVLPGLGEGEKELKAPYLPLVLSWAQQSPPCPGSRLLRSLYHFPLTSAARKCL